MWKQYPLPFLVIITLAVYFFSFFNHFVWDDEQFIYKNVYVQNFAVKEIFTTNTIAGAGEVSNYYRPLTTLSFAFDYQFWGNNTFGYHLVNTLLHIGAGLLLYKLLLRLSLNKKTSFFTALIFLVHPIQTEAVTYINSRGDSLYSFFLLLSLLLHTYLFSKKHPTFQLYQDSFTLNKVVILLLAALSYGASILSKEIALAGAGLHVVVLLRQYSLHPVSIKKIVSEYNWSLALNAVNAITVGTYMWLRATALNFQNTFNFFDDTSIYSESVAVRLLTFLKIIFIYIKLLVWPYPLHMERSTEIITSPFNGWLFAFILLCSVLIAVSWWQWKKYKDTTILFGWSWIAVMIVPVSGIIAINGLLYEHWLYLPIIGFSIILSETTRVFFPQLLSTQALKYGLVTLTLILATLTMRQNYFWSTPIRLYTHLLKYTDSARIHNNLAMAYSEEGMYQQAIEHYHLSLEYGMPYPQIYHNLGNTYATIGELEQAEEQYKKALEINPDFYHTYPNLVKLYLDQENYAAAVQIAQLAQLQYPETIEYHLLELELYAVEGNTFKFDEKKHLILQQYGHIPEVSEFIETLRFKQEK